MVAHIHKWLEKRRRQNPAKNVTAKMSYIKRARCTDPVKDSCTSETVVKETTAVFAVKVEVSQHINCWFISYMEFSDRLVGTKGINTACFKVDWLNVTPKDACYSRRKRIVRIAKLQNDRLERNQCVWAFVFAKRVHWWNLNKNLHIKAVNILRWIENREGILIARINVK